MKLYLLEIWNMLMPKDFYSWLRSLPNFEEIKQKSESKTGFKFEDDIDAFASYQLKSKNNLNYEDILKLYIKNIGL